MKTGDKSQEEKGLLGKLVIRLTQMFMSHPILSPVFVLAVFGVLAILFFMTDPGIRVLNMALDKFSGEKYVSTEERNRQEVVKATVNREVIDDVRDIRERLEKIEKNLGTSSSNEERVISCGINNVDIQKWELSVTTDNKYNLKLHDKVMIYNKDYSEHIPTAIFYVTAVSQQKKENSPEIYMTEETADAMDIPNANFKGKFSVVMKKLDK